MEAHRINRFAVKEPASIMARTSIHSNATHPEPGIRVLKSFTLIELLVVVAIIAVLVAILLPALSRAREAGRRALCGANLRTLTTAMLMYTDEFGGFFPYNSMGDPDTGSGPDASVYGYRASPRLLMGDNDQANPKADILAAFHCPGSPVGGPLTVAPVWEYYGDSFDEYAMVRNEPFRSVQISYQWDCIINNNWVPLDPARYLSGLSTGTPIIWDMYAGLDYFCPWYRECGYLSHAKEGGNVAYTSGAVIWADAAAWVGSPQGAHPPHHW